MKITKRAIKNLSLVITAVALATFGVRYLDD
jgi:hypothetical protein